MSVHNTKNYNKSIWILRNKLSGDETQIFKVQPEYQHWTGEAAAGDRLKIPQVVFLKAALSGGL